MLSEQKVLLCALFPAVLLCSATLSHAQQPLHPALLPEPVHVSYGSGYVSLSELCLAPLHNPAAEDRFALQTLLGGLGETPAACALGRGVPLRLERTGPVAALPAPGETPGPNSREAYTIDVSKQEIVLRGHSSAGEYYAVETLLQMIERDTQGRPRIPFAHVEDWPALSYRATLVDVGSEGPMLTFAELKRQIDFLAKWKDNQFFFYSEGNIEMKGYPLLNPDAQFTQDQVREVVAYARQRHIDVVPAIEMYGHLHDLFRIEKYAHLADFPHGGQFDATNPEVKKVLADWAGQIASLFPSPFVDVGFDETWSLQQAAAQTPDSTPVKLFIQQLNTVAHLFQERGKTVMAYADIMVKFPGIVAQLPHGIIALPWWYTAAPDPEYHHWLDPLIANHIPNMVTPAVTSWDQIAPDFTTSFDNIDTLLVAGRRSHSIGLLNTVWTDDDQMLMQMSWPGMAYGAAAAWQQRPMDQHSFFTDYARLEFPTAVAPDMAAALGSLNAAEGDMQSALSVETTRDFWRDPFTQASLQELQGKYDVLRQGRLAAEDALTHLYTIRQTAPQTPRLDSYIFGAQALDLEGMKFIYAGEIERAWKSLPPHPTQDEFMNAVGVGISNETHSRMMDMMDAVTGTRALYRKAWLEQYTPHRLGTATGHWDAEYFFWLRALTNFENLRRSFTSGEALPDLHTLLIQPE